MTGPWSSSSRTVEALPSAPPGAPFLERHFHACAGALLAVMLAAMLAGVFLDSDTVDEAYHLRSGYTFLKTGMLRADLEHPPLSQVLSALPLLLFHLRFQADASPGGNQVGWGSDGDFLYQNSVPAETILTAGRLVKVVLTLLLGAFIAWWTRRHFGAIPALAALLLFAFDPTFIAHGHLATTDLAAAFSFFAACMAWNAFLARGGMRGALRCGLVTGIALAVKYSAMLLPVLFVLWYAMEGFRQAAALETPRWRCSLGHFLKSMAVVAAGAFVALYLCYGFETRPLLPAELSGTPLSTMLLNNSSTASLGAKLLRHPALARAVDSAAVRLPIPAPSFWRGMFYLSGHNARGHTAYLLGNVTGSAGWWYYFPVVFKVKTPTGLLALLLLAAAASCSIVLRAGPRNFIFKVLRARREWYALTIPPLVYFAVATTSHINIGVRHILPVYPFLFIWPAAMLFTFRRPDLPRFFRMAAAICLALVAVESAAAFPRYIAFFNWPSGGRSQGWRYLVDSNLDWGQDMKRLRGYLKRSGAAGNVCLAAFTVAPPAHFGITAHPIPSSAEGAQAQGCVVAVSMSVLYEWRPRDGSYDWLEHREPTAYVGDSFRVYDMRKPR